MTDADTVLDRLAALPADKRALFERMLVARQAGRAGGVPRRDRTVAARLAPPQRRLWFMDQLAPGSPVYNAVVAIRVRGPLDVALVRQVMQRIVERHEILHTVIRPVDGLVAEPGPPGSPPASQSSDVRQIVLTAWELTFEVVDLSGAGAPGPAGDDARLEAAVGSIREFCRRPYDLAQDLPMRVTVIALAADDHLIGVAEHHIAFDGWSDEVLFRELGEGYSALSGGRAWTPEPLPTQYGDVAEWWHSRPVDAEAEEYWRARLAGAPAAPALPLDRPHPPVPRYAGAHVPLRIPDVLAELAALRTQQSATSFMVLVAALTAAVFRWSGTADLVVGSPFANRTHSELAPLIGFFSNTLPLRLQIDADSSFRTLVGQTRAECIAAFRHQEVAFERIVALSRQPRDRRRNPVFQVNLRVQQGAPPLPDLAGATASPVDVDLGFARFDLAADLLVTADLIEGYVEYNSDVFRPATIDDFVRWTSAFVQDCLRRPDEALRDLNFGPAAGSVRGRRRGPTVANP